MKQKKIVWMTLNAKYTHTSLALRYLRAVSRDLADTEILELTINNHLLEILGRICEREPDVLGIVCYIWNIEMIRQLLRLLPKVLPQTTLICGGPEVSYDTGAFMREFPMVDYVVRGEGEEVIPALLHCLDTGEEPVGLAGIAWRSRPSGQIVTGTAVTVGDMAAVPFPYDAEEMPALRERILYYETSRGCPFTCAYCLSCATQGVRYLPLERVMTELRFFVRQNVRQVKFVDRTFNANKAHFMPILEFIAQLRPECRTNFHFEIAVDYMDDEVLDLLERMPVGRVQLEIGIQSTNETTLADVSRVNHWQRIRHNIQRIMAYHNMHVHVDLIIGLPHEDQVSFARSFNDVYALQTDMLQLGFLKFLKGSAMMSLAQEGDYRYMDMAPYTVLANRWLSYQEIYWFQIFESVFESYYNAGRCRRTAAYFIREYEDGDAFSFYRKFTDYWKKQEYHHMAHAVQSLYAYMRDFCQSFYPVEAAMTDALLRFDALTADHGRIRPLLLNWNLEKYQAVTAAFWKDGRASRYISGYHFTNWRDLRRRYHLEIFDYNVQQADQGRLQHQTAVLLFNYEAVDVIWYVVDKEDLQFGKDL